MFCDESAKWTKTVTVLVCGVGFSCSDERGSGMKAASFIFDVDCMQKVLFVCYYFLFTICIHHCVNEI